MDDGAMDGGGMEGWLDARTNSGRVDIKCPALSPLLGYALAIKLRILATAFKNLLLAPPTHQHF